MTTKQTVTCPICNKPNRMITKWNKQYVRCSCLRSRLYMNDIHKHTNEACRVLAGER